MSINENNNVTSDNNNSNTACDAPFKDNNSIEQLSKESLEKRGFVFQQIGHNDFYLQGLFYDQNGIEINWYRDNTFGVPYGTEGNVMDLKSMRDLVLLRMLLTGELYSEPEHISALKTAVAKKLNSEQEQERSVATMPNSSNVADNQKEA